MPSLCQNFVVIRSDHVQPNHQVLSRQFPTKARKMLKLKNYKLSFLQRIVTNNIPTLIYLYYLFEQKILTFFFWFSSHCTFFRKHIKQKKNVVVAIIMHNTRAWGQAQWNIWGQWGFFPIYFLADALTLFKSGGLHTRYLSALGF